MNNYTTTRTVVQTISLLLLSTASLVASAQVPVDDSGKTIGAYEPALDNPDADLIVGNEEIPLMSEIDLEVLVGPIALYPDDLLAIVLPASAYPLQLIDAARFLDEVKRDPSLEPDPEWDDSVVALLNYPEVIELLNEDIDWTWRLGEAVVSQQGDVVSAIEVFRDRAYAAGNLKSDTYQNITRDEGVIEITPVAEDVIYVPYYEPERVVVYQPRPVYYYYPRSYPVYYYPYTSAYEFDRGFFWGVTTAFAIGWRSESLHVYHHSYHGHPYYGRSYRDRYWYRRPTMNVYNTTYVRNNDVTINHYYNGDRWRPRQDRREYTRDRSARHASVVRNREYKRHVVEAADRPQTARRQEPIQFRVRPARNHDARQQQQGRNPQATRQREDRDVAQRRQQRSAPTTEQHRSRTAPATRQQQARPEPVRQARTQTRGRAEPQRQAGSQSRERPAPQRQARAQPRERAAPQRQATPPARERATVQRRTAPQPRERAAPRHQEKREARGESRSSENRQGGSRERRAKR